jgi:outer membrane protein, heavy metal efflux system
MRKPQPSWAALTLAVLALQMPLPASAQPQATPPPVAASAPSLGAASDAAWRRSAAGRSAAERRADIDARRSAAASWLADAPSLAVAERSDRLNDRQGFREWEAEAALPLQWPGARRANRAVAEADAGAFDSGEVAGRLQIAGEVREALWLARLALADHESAQRRSAEAAVFVDDVSRRVRAGDLARTDLNAASSLQQQVLASLAQAEGEVLRTQRAWRTLTGFDALPADVEAEAAREGDLEAHAALLSRRKAVDAARAKLGLASATAWGSPELTLGVTRERDVAGAANVQTTRIGLRIPFPLSSQTQPRLAAGRAEIAQAEAELALARERLEADAEGARAELAQARRVEQLTAERARLADDSHALIDKAFRLGQADLPTRLRAESERFDARLAARRASLEVGRALSRLQQTFGVLP